MAENTDWKAGLPRVNWNSQAARDAAKTGGTFRRTATTTREEDDRAYRTNPPTAR
jgi:hypothetical protein